MLSSDSRCSSRFSFVDKCRTPVSIVANKSFFAGVVFVVNLRQTCGSSTCCGCTVVFSSFFSSSVSVVVGSVGSGVVSTGWGSPGGG
eukprot:2262140-Amphidinium_carterae.1